MVKVETHSVVKVMQHREDVIRKIRGSQISTDRKLVSSKKWACSCRRSPYSCYTVVMRRRFLQAVVISGSLLSV